MFKKQQLSVLFNQFKFTNRLNQQFASTKSNLIKLKVNDVTVSVPQGTFLIDAIRKAGFDVPTLCYHSDLPSSGGICRVCLVCEKSKPNRPIIACKQKVREGMDIDTTSEKMNTYRQANVALLFSNHPSQCITCFNAQRCEGEQLCAQMNYKDSIFNPILYSSKKEVANAFIPQEELGKKPAAILKSDLLCINCDRCLRTCEDLQGIGVYSWMNDKDHNFSSVGTYAPNMYNECVNCGQCILHCPTGALYEKHEIQPILKACADKNKRVVFFTAPTIKIVIGEEFGLKPGEKVMKHELVSGLKLLGQNVTVMDATLSADLTIMEEGTELIHRLANEVANPSADQKESKLPMFTSCCPGWIDYIEKNYSDYLHKLSTCKSPQNMLGATIKTYFAKKYGWDPKKLVTVSIMPCTAKKIEKDRVEMQVDGLRDVDYAITTRECAKMLKLRNIDITKLTPKNYDNGEDATGAGTIFAITGGVMEAAVRTAYEIITGQEVPFKDLDLHLVRGFVGIKEGFLPIEKTAPGYEAFQGKTLRVAIAHTLRNAKIILEKLKQCEKEGKPYPWDFIEIMTCRGGCIGGGGQPKPLDDTIREKRAKLVYSDDHNSKYRKSHLNPEIAEIYQNYFGKPNGKLSHKILHTHYFNNKKLNGVKLDEGKQSEIRALLQENFEPKPEFVLEALLKVADKQGYINEQAILEMGKFFGVQPSAIVSTASYYLYVPLQPQGDTTFYVCTCQNCMMKGSQELQSKFESWLGIKMGQTTTDGKYTLKRANWLGWCVNGAPGVMMRRKGQEYVVPIVNALKLDDISQVTQMDHKMPEDGIKRLPYNGLKDPKHPSFFEEIDIDAQVKKALAMGPEKLIEEVKISGLQGRGGAGFPAAIKWDAVRKQKAPMKYVVINADEGLPCTFKDWVLMSNDTQRKSICAGTLLCAWSAGASECYYYLRYEYRNLKELLLKDAEEIKANNPELANIKFIVRLGNGPYVAGERTALYESIEGRGARPRTDRNQSSTKSGLFNRPTVTNNVETICGIPFIVKHGGKKWAEYKGEDGELGLKLYSISGDLEQSTVVELPMGSQFKKILKTAGVSNIKAAECGGATEPIVTSKDFEKSLGFNRGTLGGVGSIVLYNDSRNIADYYLHKMEFLKDESCQQCVPCRDGSKVLVKAIHDHISGEKHLKDNNYIDIIGETVAATSLCGHGQGLGKLFGSISKYLKAQK